MKTIRVLFVFAVVSMLVMSCKDTKKEEVTDDASIEMTEEAVESEEGTASESDASTSSESDHSDAAAAGAAATGAAASGAEAEGTAASNEAASGIDAESKGLEEIPVPEGVIAEELADTPVIYPGCSGSAEEIRACNRQSFIAFIQGEFDKNIAPSLNLGGGDFEIKSFLHIDEAGKMSALKIVAPDPSLEAEMKRVIGKVPAVAPATEGGQPVGISFMLPVKFKVEI